MSDDVSAPLHVQALERFLDIKRLLNEVERVLVDPLPNIKYSWDAEDEDGGDTDAGILVDRDNQQEEKYIYETADLTEENVWLKDMLLSESSESSDEDVDMTEEEMKRMLRKHKQMKKIMDKTRHQPQSYAGYSTSVLGGPEQPYYFGKWEAPSLDYSNKTKRGKKVVRSRTKHSTVTPLSIEDMIDALTSHCVTDKTPPPELSIEAAEPPAKKSRDVRPRDVTSLPVSRDMGAIWRSATQEAVKGALKRKCMLENACSKRLKICTELKLGSVVLKANKHCSDVTDRMYNTNSDTAHSSTSHVSCGTGNRESNRGINTSWSDTEPANVSHNHKGTDTGQHPVSSDKSSSTNRDTQPERSEPVMASSNNELKTENSNNEPGVVDELQSRSTSNDSKPTHTKSENRVKSPNSRTGGAGHDTADPEVYTEQSAAPQQDCTPDNSGSREEKPAPDTEVTGT